MRVEVTIQPGAEPVLLAEAKLHCRIEDAITEDDALVTALIKGARDTVERFLNRKLITQTLKASFDNGDSSLYKQWIELQFPPILSITSITSYGADDVPAVFGASNYRLSGSRAVLGNNASWPTPGREFDALEIVYVAGYGAAGSSVPEPIKLAIKMLVAHWYESREAAGDPVISEAKGFVIPFGVQQILLPFRIYSI